MTAKSPPMAVHVWPPPIANPHAVSSAPGSGAPSSDLLILFPFGHILAAGGVPYYAPSSDLSILFPFGPRHPAGRCRRGLYGGPCKVSPACVVQNAGDPARVRVPPQQMRHPCDKDVPKRRSPDRSIDAVLI